MDAGEEAEESARQVAQSQPVHLGARAGLVAYGVMHLLVAWLAVRVAMGGHNERADQTGALQMLAVEPLGGLLLWLVVAAFAAVVVWRLSQAIWGFRYLANKTHRTMERLFSAGQVVVFGVFTALAARVAIGTAGGGGQAPTAAVLRVAGGRWLVAAVGVGFVVTGVVVAYRGSRKTFVEDLNLDEAGPLARTLTERFGQVGYVAKGVAIAAIGVLIGLAALYYQPAQAEGLDIALKTLAAQPFGPLLLGAVALGLASYGVFCFFDARYHRV